MENIIFINNILTFRGQDFSCGNSYILDDLVIINLINIDNDFNAILVPYETSINDVIQTSAQMIIDTLSNG